MIRTLSLSSITLDARAQSRAGLNEAVVAEYAEAMRAGEVFPPLVVFSDGEDHWLSEGFHRHAGATRAGHYDLSCDVREGDLRQAILHSVGANASHGLRRTNDDKRRAVTLLLNDEEWSAWSDREIARQCAVSHEFVRKLRPSSVNVDRYERTVERAGQSFKMNTAAIGRKPEAAEQTSPDTASETRGGTGDDCSVGKRGAWPPLDGASSSRGNDSPEVVTAGETASTNIVQLGSRQSALSSFSDLDREIEAEEAADEVRSGPEIDLCSLEGRAHAINGSLSTIAMIEITGTEYWSVFSRDPARKTYEEWVRDAYKKLSNILKEIDHVGHQGRRSTEEDRRV